MTTVLVVNQEPMTRAAWKYVLEERGYEVFSAQDAADSAEICQGVPMDLILMDIDGGCPPREALAAIATVRDASPAGQMLVLADWNMDRSQVLQAGATVCIARPVDHATVLKLADMMVSRAAARRWSGMAVGVK